MSYMMVAMAVVSAVGGLVSAQASRNQGKAAEQVAENNAIMGEYAAQDAQRRGEEEAQALLRKGADIKSSQRAALAAKGLDLGYGTAADIQDQTDFFAQSDAATARDNAAREAWSRRAGAQTTRAEGQFAARNSNLQATGTLLSTAGSVAGSWYRGRTPTASKTTP